MMTWLKNLFKKKVSVKNIPNYPKVPIKEEVKPISVKQLHGIDISHHNSKVDFSKVRADFIFMKATEGKSFVSPVYKTRMDIAMSKGFSCGAYHYYKPTIDPIEQARHFCKHIKGDLSPVLDIEDPYIDRIKLIRELGLFLDYVEKETGKIPIIYTGYSYIKDMNLPNYFSRYPLWLAWYTTADRVKAPLPWKNWTYWQYSESAMVEGIGKCDVNWYRP